MHCRLPCRLDVLKYVEGQAAALPVHRRTPRSHLLAALSTKLLRSRYRNLRVGSAICLGQSTVLSVDVITYRLHVEHIQPVGAVVLVEQAIRSSAIVTADELWMCVIGPTVLTSWYSRNTKPQ